MALNHLEYTGFGVIFLKFKTLICLCLLAALLCPMALCVEVSARSAALYDPDTGRFLYEKNAGEQLPMASTTKIMTALLVLESMELDQVVKVRPEYLRTEGSSMYLAAGEEVTVETLLYGLLLLSGNDAAKTLAAACAGSEEAFVERMNLRAQELGLTGTHFVNPHGLPDDGHYSTAQDMARLMAVCLQNETFREISGTVTYTGGGRTMKNHNRLLTLYDDATGGKTGFTKKAGRCLVSSAEREGSSLVAVTLGAPDDWNDHRALYEYGFAEYPLMPLVEAGTTAAELPILGGTGGQVAVLCPQGLSLRLTETERNSVSIQLNLPHLVYAPVSEGSQAGTLLVSWGEGRQRELPLVFGGSAEVQPVELSFWEKCKWELKKIANGLHLW